MIDPAPSSLVSPSSAIFALLFNLVVLVVVLWQQRMRRRQQPHEIRRKIR